MNYDDTSAEERAQANDLRRRASARSARRYDKQIGFCERRVFGTDHRPWASSRAIGRTLEVAVGTGLNLPHYPDGVELVGLDLSPEMLALAVDRANDLGRASTSRRVTLRNAPFRTRRLILVDHIASSVKAIYWLQRFIEFFSKRTEGEYQTRRPMIQVKEAGYVVQDHERLRAGVMERLVALKPIS